MLIVGGDSFAQFPRQWYQCESTEETLNPVPEFNQSLDFKHWGQLLADQGNMESKSVGVGGGDISSTTAITMQEIHRSPATHCLFFITTFPRTIVNRLVDRKHTTEIAPHTVFGTNYKKFYKDTNVYDNDLQRAHVNKPGQRLIGEDWWYNTPDIQGPTKDSISNYLDHLHVETDLHNKWSNLTALAYTCQKKNIKLVFVTPFSNSPSINTFLKFTEFDHFNYMADLYGHLENFRRKVVGKENFKWLRTHHTEEQHFEILDHFNKCFPNWLDK